MSNEKERVWVHTCHTLFKQNDNAIALVYDDDMQGKIDKHHHNFFAGMFRTHGYVRSLSFCWPCKKEKKRTSILVPYRFGLWSFRIYVSKDSARQLCEKVNRKI